jgi:hypothetical protein
MASPSLIEALLGLLDGAPEDREPPAPVPVVQDHSAWRDFSRREADRSAEGALPRLDPKEVVAALLAEKWNEDAARRITQRVPVVVDEARGRGYGVYYGGSDPHVVLGARDSLPKTVSHEMWHGWDDQVVDGPGLEPVDVARLAGDVRALSGYAGCPWAARAAKSSLWDALGDEVHLGHYVWDRVGQDMRRLPRWYAEKRLAMMRDLERADCMPYRTVLPIGGR